MKLDRSFFRGTEFPRLVILALVMIGGWIVVYVLYTLPQPPRPQPLTVAQMPPLPPPAAGPEFQGIQDRRPLSLRDSAAYDVLLHLSRDRPYEELNRQSRHDILFSQILDNPQRYRGLPIHLNGTVLRVLQQDARGSSLFPRGQYFEAYAITPDSGNFPWFLVFEEAPANLQVGDDLRQHITFDGYFLKLLSYQAADTLRVAPVLVGRFPSALESVVRHPESNWSRDTTWLAILIVVLTFYIGVRVYFQLRRYRSPAGLTGRSSLEFDQINPEVLTQWIEKVPEEPDGDSIDKVVT